MAKAALLVGLLGGRAHADADDEVQRARQLFAEARALESAGDWPQALQRLQKALTTKQTPGLWFHVGYCQEKLGSYVEAMESYGTAELLIAEGAKAGDVSQLIGPRKESLSARMPLLMVRIEPKVPDVSLTIDERAVRADAVEHAIPGNPGEHAIHVSASGYRPADTRAVLREKETTVVSVYLVPSSTPLPASPRASDPFSRPPSPPAERLAHPLRAPLLLVEGAVTAVALAFGIEREFAAASAAERVRIQQQSFPSSQQDPTMRCGKDAAPTVSSTCKALEEASSDRQNAVWGARIGFASAGVGALAMVGTWFLLPTSSVTTAPALLPTATRSGAMLQCAFRF